MRFIRLSNDFLSLLSRQALLCLELEFHKFAMLLVWIHLSHLLVGVSVFKGLLKVNAWLSILTVQLVTA